MRQQENFWQGSPTQWWSLKESYEAYENKVEAPPQDGNGGVGYLDATATR
jgi:hypothetical protein